MKYFFVYQRKGKETVSGCPNLPMELSSASKAQNNIGCYNLLPVCISCQRNERKLEYSKDCTSSKTGLNWEIYFIENILKMGHNQYIYRNVFFEILNDVANGDGK